MFVSVIIPNYNGAHLLPTCLDSLRAQRWSDHEVIVVDNASSDNSRELLSREYPEVRVIALDRNRYFAGAVNVGIRASHAPAVALLNNDTEADRAWLSELCRGLATHPEVGMVASKMLLFDRRNVINSAGDFYRVDGVPGNRGVWEVDEGQYDREEAVFGPCAGAALYRRSMLDDIGLFDEDLVAYCEDVDLSWRAQLAGWSCLYVPTARVYHRLSSTGGGPFASYYCGRNFINVAIKNLPASVVRQHWPRILLAQLRLAAEAIAHAREPAARARLRGQVAALRQLPLMLRKRREVQSLRRVDDAYLVSLLAPLPRARQGKDRKR